MWNSLNGGSWPCLKKKPGIEDVLVVEDVVENTATQVTTRDTVTWETRIGNHGPDIAGK